jgi:hypothetical protein
MHCHFCGFFVECGLKGHCLGQFYGAMTAFFTFVVHKICVFCSRKMLPDLEVTLAS